MEGPGVGKSHGSPFTTHTQGADPMGTLGGGMEGSGEDAGGDTSDVNIAARVIDSMAKNIPTK
jgi:hypothetical protein